MTKGTPGMLFLEIPLHVWPALLTSGVAGNQVQVHTLDWFIVMEIPCIPSSGLEQSVHASSRGPERAFAFPRLQAGNLLSLLVHSFVHSLMHTFSGSVYSSEKNPSHTCPCSACCAADACRTCPCVEHRLEACPLSAC